MLIVPLQAPTSAANKSCTQTAIEETVSLSKRLTLGPFKQRPRAQSLLTDVTTVGSCRQFREVHDRNTTANALRLPLQLHDILFSAPSLFIHPWQTKTVSRRIDQSTQRPISQPRWVPQKQQQAPHQRGPSFAVPPVTLTLRGRVKYPAGQERRAQEGGAVRCVPRGYPRAAHASSVHCSEGSGWTKTKTKIKSTTKTKTKD